MDDEETYEITAYPIGWGYLHEYGRRLPRLIWCWVSGRQGDGQRCARTVMGATIIANARMAVRGGRHCVHLPWQAEAVGVDIGARRGLTRAGAARRVTADLGRLEAQ